MLIRNTLYNLGGLGLPLVVAVGSMPVLIHSLGDARFGVLTLIWAVVSYFGLFDLGLGRALTQQLAVLFAEQRESDIPATVSTSLWILGLLGIVAGGLMWIFADWGVARISYHGNLKEIQDSIRIMAFAMPFIVLTSGFRGILEAKLAFGIINAIRLPMGIFTFIGPLIVVLWVRNDLAAITLVLTFGRAVACVVHGYFCTRCVDMRGDYVTLNLSIVKDLLKSGGWMTISNIVSPLMGYFDRFIIGLTISAAAVAYYVTPFEIVSKLWVIPGALTAVIFPKFASYVIGDDEFSKVLFRKALTILFLVLFPATLVTAFFAKEILQIWIGADFSQNSYILLQIFSFGILINCLSHIPFTFLQGVGKARITAIIHMIEFPLYVLILWGATVRWGLFGAAFAWLLRILIDSAAMFLQSFTILKLRFSVSSIVLLSVLFGLVTTSFLLSAIRLTETRFILLPIVLMSVNYFCWRLLFTTENRKMIRHRLQTMLGQGNY